MQTSLQTLPLWAQLVLLIVPAASAIFAAVGLLLHFLPVAPDQCANSSSPSSLNASKDSQKTKTFSAFYAIEYSKFKYDEEFHGSKYEREIDKLLRHFSNIALAWQAGLLSTRDVRPIQYYVLRVVRNAEIQKYLKFIANWSKQQKLGEHPYAVLSQLSERLPK
jgi:hypothetical protein